MRFPRSSPPDSPRSRRRLYLSGALFLAGIVLAVGLLKCRTSPANAAPVSRDDGILNVGAVSGESRSLLRLDASGLQAGVPPLTLDRADRSEPVDVAGGAPYTVYRDLVYAYRSLRQNPEDAANQAEATPADSETLALLADVYLPMSQKFPDVRTSGDLRAGPRPAVVIIHGGSWQRGDRARMASIAGGLAAAGFVAVNIEYSLAPRHRFPAQLEDCRAAVRWIREHAGSLSVDAKRIGAFGYSAGAHLALMLATTGRPAQDSARIQAVVAGAPPANLSAMPQPANRTLRRLLGADREEAPQLYRAASPVSHVTPDDPPAFLYHGRYDWVVPVQQSREMAERLRTAGVPVELFESDGGHLSSAPFREERPFGLQAAIAFLKRHL